MNEYMPSTEEVRASAVWGAFLYPDEFDRWLNEERAKAWDEGNAVRKGDVVAETDWGPMIALNVPNPYRKGVE